MTVNNPILTVKKAKLNDNRSMFKSNETKILVIVNQSAKLILVDNPKKKQL